MVSCKAETQDSLGAFLVHRNAAPCGKAFTPFVAAQGLEDFAGEVVYGCSGTVARWAGDQSQLRLVGFGPALYHDIGSLITRDSHITLFFPNAASNI
ncbi:hypothetical protein CDAR_469351 [Caerostris darwini]|uniref:Uncharacterized protein n=1 Tax=Caerostris darwini TaxID=1538125 RepID=A0AAV4R0B9_9ARAC|nr:hypothetical protein CDAR_469351 [Caerostris darwini]